MTRRAYDNDEPDDVDSSYYVEKDTGLIYETKFFPDFALIRLMMPDHTPPVARIGLVAFAEQFEEFFGDVKELRSLLFGSTASYLEVSKKNGRDG